MITRTTKVRRSIAAAVLAGLCAAGCAAPARFALRPPVLRDGDDRPFERPPANDEESNYANSVDVILLRPISHAFLFEVGGESRNVNSLDEVADSTWFTNRAAAPADLERGPCPDAGPVPPFTVKSSKTGGTTPGFVVKDSRGQRYMLKLDALVPDQPEISTAADAIVSRLYWAAGFNAPCNDVIHIDAADLRVDQKSIENLPTGDKIPLTAARVIGILGKATRGPGGKIRLGASRFIDGEPAGTWRSEGTRKDDPNDVIAHEDRRDLRGERFLAAWVNHWDSRGPQTFDAFVRVTKAGGYIRHYFLDFSDSLGGTTKRTQWAEPRLGFTTVSNAPQIATDAITFGFVRRPWDEVRVDPRYPNLGYLDVEHFEPMRFSPQTPLVRWARAQPADLAWMARRIARFGIDHVRAAVKVGKLGNRVEEARLVEILMGRREKILRVSFATTSPLADLALEGPERICATDLAVASGLSAADKVSYELQLLEGAEAPEIVGRAGATPRTEAGARLRHAPALRPRGQPRRLPGSLRDLEITRAEGAQKTTLRAHFYDMGVDRGYSLAGVERP